MSRYIILSKFVPGAYTEPSELKELAAAVSKRIEEYCPGVTWKDSYATSGAYDVVDIVEADDPAQVEKAAMLIQGHGKASTQTMTAAPWNQFLKDL